ncbi:MAG: alpha/beta fold hydrolase, partial [Acidimicrobiaceae bacterium]|nr:alpha/beta fold hydrolase [Acidimicrobiaceae bacterium]
MNFQISESNDMNSQQLKVLKSPATASQLAFTSYLKEGATPSERVVMIHGFTQNGDSYRNIARVLASQHGLEVVCVDLPGHGGSSEIAEQIEEATDILWRFGQDS